MKSIILIGLLVIVFISGCFPKDINTIVQDAAEKYCLNHGFDGMEFVYDNVLDGKFNCINITAETDLDKLYQGVIYKWANLRKK